MRLSKVFLFVCLFCLGFWVINLFWGENNQTKNNKQKPSVLHNIISFFSLSYMEMWQHPVWQLFAFFVLLLKNSCVQKTLVALAQHKAALYCLLLSVLWKENIMWLILRQKFYLLLFRRKVCQVSLFLWYFCLEVR